MDPEDSSSHSQATATYPYPEPAQTFKEFMVSNSLFITFFKSLRLELVYINQYNLQVTFVYIFHEQFLSSDLCR
jgi:hypothetical protein